MATKKMITKTRLKIHDDMTSVFYQLKRAGLITPALQVTFNASHLENELDKEAELRLASDYIIPTPQRNHGQEIDEIKADIVAIRSKTDFMRT